MLLPQFAECLATNPRFATTPIQLCFPDRSSTDAVQEAKSRARVFHPLRKIYKDACAIVGPDHAQAITSSTNHRNSTIQLSPAFVGDKVSEVRISSKAGSVFVNDDGTVSRVDPELFPPFPLED